jgi:excisionase family DNA binding protein
VTLGLLSLHDVAALTTLSYSTVKTLIARRKIRSVTVGRRRLVHPADFEAWADGLRSQTTNDTEILTTEKKELGQCQENWD